MAKSLNDYGKGPTKGVKTSPVKGTTKGTSYPSNGNDAKGYRGNMPKK